MTYEIFYDTETTGPEPRFDQVLQYAAIRTDEDFVEIDTVDIRSQLAAHMIPTPGALKVTHVDPYEIARAPFNSYDYARHLHSLITGWIQQGDTDFSGWNTLNYDEEIMRQCFWMNLLDPYLSSGNGKRRVDYLVIARALAARNPEIIEIPINPDTGKRNFKLENIATANGFSDHNAHDALGDVRATIHMARLIRDLDPSLFAHAKAMGGAKAAIDFVESEQVFRLLGGAMVEPGILDVCLLASDPSNPKAKVAWNLAVDPTPFIAMEPEDILAAMKKSGTPFRSVRCHKSPMAFPMNWEFLRHAAKDEAPDTATIDQRSKQVLEHPEFRAKVAEALKLKVQGYDDPEFLEEKIYSGFPSWPDKTKMKQFHEAPDWRTRLDIARSFENSELRQLAIRLVWGIAPEALSDTHRKAIGDAVAESRFGLDTDVPWTTVGKFMAELEEWDEKLPDDPELANIRKWALETFPAARTWKKEPDDTVEDTPMALDKEAHFLDGID